MQFDLYNIFLKFGISLVLGLLVGLQREYASEETHKELSAGIRTFALMGLVGCIAANIADILGSPWPYVVIILIAGSLLCLSFFVQAWRGHIGLTTEFSALATILAGSLVYLEQIALAIALTVAIAVLLSLKIEMHRFVHKLTKTDIIAILKFAVITAIVLPVLPNQNYGPEPFNIFNPYKIWLLVVLISGISFIGYISIKLLGAKKGLGFVGFLGGLASSTAVTLTMTQRSRSHPELSKSFLQAVLIAWTVMYVRLFVIVAAVNFSIIKYLWFPVAVGVFMSLLFCLYLFFSQKHESQGEHITFANPFELGPAIKFGILFSMILLLSKAAQIYLGDVGLYIASLVSGLADVDAITLSLAGLSLNPEDLSYQLAAKAIIIASISNTILKGMVILLGGSPQMRKITLPATISIVLTVLLGVLFS